VQPEEPTRAGVSNFSLERPRALTFVMAFFSHAKPARVAARKNRARSCDSG
jgi:hypothetical protein